MMDSADDEHPAYLRRVASARTLRNLQPARGEFERAVKLLRYVTMEQGAALDRKAAEVEDRDAKLAQRDAELAEVRALLEATQAGSATQKAWHAIETNSLRQALGDTSQALASKSAAADVLSARAAATESELARLISSASWRATAPLRSFVSRHPGCGRWLRRGLRLGWWAITLQLPSRMHAWNAARRGVATEPAESKRAALPSGRRESRAWHGSEPVAKSSWFSQQGSSVDDATFDKQTQALWRRYFPIAHPQEPPCWFMQFGPTKTIRAALVGSRAPVTIAACSAPVSYAIITIYYQHRRFFPACAASVASLIEGDLQRTGDHRIEWIVISDDSDMDQQELKSLVPANLKARTRVYADRQHRGISVRLNEALKAAQKEWLLLVDCDDLIQPEAPAVLDYYIHQFPGCRYISSDIIDIDDDGMELRRRYRVEDPSVLYKGGMVAGHLKAIRRDLVAEVGGFLPQFSGCQDYDFALRVALQEPLLFIPDFLYSYRWHDGSVSVSRATHQNKLTRAVRQAFLLRYLDRSWPAKARPQKQLEPAPRGLCLVRTQGSRLEFLAETLQSIWDQTLPVVPCVIVHGEADTFAFMQRWAQKFHEPLVLLHAGAAGRRRGYPLNVGLEHALSRRSEYESICILDDDDVYYPLFAERLCNAMALTGAGLVFGLTNARSMAGGLSAAYPPLPAAALVAGNFIPTNSFILRLDALLETAVRFREDLHYLEDWDFLLSLLAAGVDFHAVWETLAEFRLLGDGNVDVRRSPDLFAHCEAEVHSHARQVARSLGAGAFYRDLATFDFGRREALAGPSLGCLTNAHQMFEVPSAGRGGGTGMKPYSSNELGVSVLLPVFLRQAAARDIFWLRRALESVHDQAYPGKVEVLIVDDGSAMPVEGFAAELGAAGSRVRWIRHHRNRGLVHALNSGLRHASHPLIARMDADDEWLPGKIVKQLKLFADDPDLTIAGTGMERVTPSGEAVDQHVRPADWKLLLRFMFDVGCPFPHGSVVARTAIYRLLGGYPHDAALAHCEDFALWGTWLRFFKPAMLEEVFYRYTMGEGSVSAYPFGTAGPGVRCRPPAVPRPSASRDPAGVAN